MTSAAEAPKMGRSDFPEWVPPMLVKELRQGLRSQVFALMLSLMHLAMVMVFIFSMEFDDPNKPLSVSENFFWVALSILLLGVAPMRGLQELSAEKQTRTLELLSAAGVSGTRLVTGKWSSLMVQSGLMALTLAPYFVLQYFAGAVDLFYQARVVALGVLLSSVMTAAALAISGRKVLVRVGWAGKIILANFILMIMILNDVLGSGWLMNAINGFAWEWLVILFGTALATFIFLRLAGDMMDAPSANGALWPRVGLWAGWIAVPLYHVLGVSEPIQVTYLGLLIILSVWVFFWHLHALRPILPVHLVPFRRLGPIAGRMAAFLFLPTWVGVPFLVIPALAGIFYYMQVSGLNPAKDREFFVIGFHAASYLLFLIFLWRVFFPGRRDANGVVRERDPRPVFGWLAAVSTLLAPVPKLLAIAGLPGVRAAGMLIPLLFSWTYKDLDKFDIKPEYVSTFIAGNIAAFCIHFGLVLILGAVWIRKKRVWKDFWSGTRSPEAGGGGENGARPWSDSAA